MGKFELYFWKSRYPFGSNTISNLKHCGKKGHDIKSFLITSAVEVLIYFKDFHDELKV